MKLTSCEQTLLGCDVNVFGKVAFAMAACELLENRAKVTRDVSAFVRARDEGVWRMVTMAWDMEPEARSVLAHARLGSAGQPMADDAPSSHVVGVARCRDGSCAHRQRSPHDAG